jgi:Asp-tRNA(Asn)/Glu-tRNA(Gln) amidotransferase A subunit family amidase
VIRDFRDHSLAELARLVRQREVLAAELTELALERIAAVNPLLNAWAVVDGDRAMDQARAIDKRTGAGEDPGPLAGIPLGVKDLDHAEGFRTGFGSALHAGDPPAAADSPMVARLRAAGCVVIGKTTTPEHGWQADTISPHWGATRNPWRLDRSPGGSSGGSAAALAAGMVPLATGSDGGGSIRIPSALCGLSAIKVTNGIVPNGGPQPPGSGFLSVRGPMARRIEDVSYALAVCAGPDPADYLSVPAPPGLTGPAPLRPEPPARVVWAPAPGYPVDSEVAAVCAGAVERLAAAGTEVITAEEVFASPPVADWYALWTVFRDRAQGQFRGTADWERIDPGLRAQMDHAHQKVSATAFTRAIDAIHAHNLDLARQLERAPVLLCPTLAGQAPRSGGLGTVDGVQSPHWASLTPVYNMTRHPAGSVCAGYTRDGLPVGLQVVAGRFADRVVLTTIRAIEEILGDDPRPPEAA